MGTQNETLNPNSILTKINEVLKSMYIYIYMIVPLYQYAQFVLQNK